jgi:glutamate--cysteine ligase
VTVFQERKHTLPKQLDERLLLLSKADNLSLLTGIQRGIEKESLRINTQGELAQTPHPRSLGSALTHPHITTDFSEALLEFITPVYSDIDEALNFLGDVHRFVYSQLSDEELWVASMPCLLAGDENIPIARYGSSNVAQMKETYRTGLANRYGKPMQTIAGIHYNFSVPDALWPLLQQQDLDKRSQQDYTTDAYFKLIRNFRRYSWLLVYLYGASPAVCKSFVSDLDHDLLPLGENSFHMPYGTSIRMGDLGYQSNKQDSLNICYNSLDNYVETLHQAIINTQPDYEKIGIKTNNGYQQLSAALLQIENEFYSSIRPKRITDSGETPLGALLDRGIEYIEVRCLDLNPYLPLGIDADQARFVDCFLLYCLFETSRLCDDEDRQRIDSNLKKVVSHGRDPQLILERLQGPISLTQWGDDIIDGIERVAQLLDQAHGGDDYQRVCQQQRSKLTDPSQTPSAQILADMEKNHQAFFQFAIAQSAQHGQYFRDHPLSNQQADYFKQQTLSSLKKQSTIEQADTIDFDEYLKHYFSQYRSLR